MNELALFAGAGGGILGGHLLGWRTVCAVEWEPYPTSVLMQRQNDGILPPFPIWDDVQTFDGKPWRGLVDVVSGGFPCQDISAAGKGAGIDGSRSGMWFHMARIIGEVRPRHVLVENSPMLTSRGLGRVLGDLATLGYDAEWGVLGAVDAGAPHKRDRIWIVATDATGVAGNQWRAECAGQLGQAGIADGCDDVADAMRKRERGKTGKAIQPNGEIWQNGLPSSHEALNKGANVADANGLRKLQPEGHECNQRGRFGDCGKDVADANGGRFGQCEPKAESVFRISSSSKQNEILPDALRQRGQLSTERKLTAIKLPRSDGETGSSKGIARDSWATEPDVGGKTDGMATKLDGGEAHD